MRAIYLDHNATTPLLPEVAAAIAQARDAGYANPASQHAAGRRARQALEDARERIGRLLGAAVDVARPDRVIFTSGGTEANNLAVFGMMPDRPGRALISAIEHPSVVGPAERLVQRGYAVERIGVSPAGVVDLERFADRLRGDVRLVSVMLANNETGVLQPVGEIATLCAAAGVPMHTDAVQVVGKLPVSLRALGVSTLSVSAHKFHGPVGVGALVVREGVPLAPQMFGGFQQGALRPGTENVALVVGMLAALESFSRSQSERTARLTALRERFEQQLLAACDGLAIHGATATRLPHTSNVAFVGRNRQALLLALDTAGVACSTGSACASGSSEPSPVLLAMGLPKEVIEGSLRFSLGAATTEAEIDEAVERIVRVVRMLPR